MGAQHQNPFAVVTGASDGIGFELARQFAINGHDLIIASNSETIFEVQDELLEYGTNVECLKINLATYHGVELLAQAIRNFGRSIDALAINAGAGAEGAFHQTNLRQEINLINLNVISALHLTKRILPEMYANRRGKILFSFPIIDSPSPLAAVYEGSKAFIATFAESIRKEIKESGITITMLQPGSVPEGELEIDPADVARHGFAALMAGSENVYSENLKTKLQTWAKKLLPHAAKESLQKH